MAFGKAKFDVQASRERMQSKTPSKSQKSSTVGTDPESKTSGVLIAVTCICVLALGGAATAMFVPNIGKTASGIVEETTAYFKSAPHVPYTGKMPATVALFSAGNTKGRVMKNKDRRKYWNKKCGSGSSSVMCKIHRDISKKR